MPRPRNPHTARPPLRRPAPTGYAAGQGGGLGEGYQPRPVAPGPRGVTQPAPAPGQATPAEPWVDPYDFSMDPILQQSRALSQKALAEAQAQAIRLRDQEGLDYADVQRGLAQDEKDKPRQLTENLNSQNLFYSSTFGQKQSELAQSLLDNRALAERRHNERLGGIEQGLLDAQNAEQDRLIGAEQDAAQRLQDRLGDLPVSQMSPGPLAQKALPRVKPSVGRAARVAGRIGPVPRRGLRI